MSNKTIRSLSSEYLERVTGKEIESDMRRQILKELARREKGSFKKKGNNEN